MNILITDEELKLLKSKDKVPLKCYACDIIFYKNKRNVMEKINNTNKRVNGCYCSFTCLRNKSRKMCVCLNCQKEFSRTLYQVKKVKNHFCSSSCSTTYNNKHKTHGTRRSKLEVYLEEQIRINYPDINMVCNQKDAINSELDFYFPDLKLAIELNGIFHYEPIYGEEKLSQIQNNDDRKFQACLERGIELCIIDSSKLVHFKEKSAEFYMQIIANILVNKVVE